MSTTVETIQTLADDRRRDSTSGTISSDKKLRAVASALNEIHSFAHWEFNRRVSSIQVYADETDYSVPDVLQISDLKDISELRKQDNHTQYFEYVDTDDFAVRSGNSDFSNYYTLERRSGTDILRVSTSTVKGVQVLGDTSAYDGDGSWTPETSTSDALSVSSDTQEYRAGGGSVMFNVDVSQSVNNYSEIYVSTTSQADLTDYYDFGKIFTWLYLPSATYVTGSTLTWGSSDSAYYYNSVTTNSQNGSFVKGWNRLAFNMNGASSSGSPDITAIDYLKFKLSYSASQADMTGVRLNGLTAKLPERLDLVYYSNATVLDSNGSYLSTPTSTTDTLIIPDRYREVVVNGTTSNLLMQMGKFDEASVYERKFQAGIQRMSQEYGIFKKNEVKSFRPSIPWPR